MAHNIRIEKINGEDYIKFELSEEEKQQVNVAAKKLEQIEKEWGDNEEECIKQTFELGLWIEKMLGKLR